MPRGAPPSPIYPNALDTDTTLYTVYNTSESVLTSDNLAWSEEITIVPVAANADEIWADNGFINISGELIYYDLVEKDVNGKVFKFKRCLRNFGGEHTQFNPQGTPVRGFVIAEHHNQLVDALLDVEDFVGFNFTPDTSTLDWRIRNLQNTPFIFDDFGCPTITLTTDVISSDPSSGTLIGYTVDIIGTVTDFTLSFGDGFITKSTQPGQHRYAPNANIDPVATATNGNCTITQTAIQRASTAAPNIQAPQDTFDVIVPEIGSLPNINVSVAPTDLNLPVIPITFPCLTLGLSAFNIPSLIDIRGALPSVIDIVGCAIPSNITFNGSLPSNIAFTGNLPSIISVAFNGSLPSVISFTGTFPSTFPSIPSQINITGGNIPSIVNITGGNIPSVINFGNLPSFPEIQFATPFFPLVQFGPVNFPVVQFLVPDFPDIHFDDPPIISVDWGTPPTISCNCSITCPGAASMTEWQQSYVEDLGFTEEEAPAIEYNFAGIPSEIKIVNLAQVPQYIAISHTLPENIEVVMPSIPEISINASAVPKEIKLAVPEIRDIRLIADNIPSIIKIEGSIPSVIKFDNPNIPSVISINASEIPSEIRVTGMPSVIRLEHDLPTAISLLMPSNPVIEVAPISVIVELSMDKIRSDNGEDLPCFALVPCKNK